MMLIKNISFRLAMTASINYAHSWYNLVLDMMVMFNKEYIYFGISDGEWKKRFSFHTMTFRKREYEGSTELSKFIWSLQDKGESYSIKWRVAAQAHPYKCGTRRCDLCITEKTLIARSRHKGMLNKRSEIISKCRHRNKFTLRSI